MLCTRTSGCSLRRTRMCLRTFSGPRMASASIRSHSKYPSLGPGFLYQSRNWAVESAWSSCLPFGKTVSSWRYSASHGASSGMRTNPFSISAVWACSSHDLVGGRLVTGDGVAAILDQLLDQLRAGGLVFDQHDRCLEAVVLLAHGAFECRISSF